MPDEMILSGIVLQTSERAMTVRVPRVPEGEECDGGCHGCTLCASGSVPPLDVRAAADPSADPPLPGDRVRIAYRPPRRGIMAALFFLPPLLGLLAGLLAAPGTGDGALTISAWLGTALGFVVAAALIKAFSGKIGARARVVAPGGEADGDNARITGA